MTHTPEPWEVEHFAGVTGLRGKEPGALIVGEGALLSGADARRIVACVNACAGLETVALETAGLTGIIKLARNNATNLVAELGGWEAMEKLDE